MAVTDPIADMLTRIRNAVNARHESVNIPASKLKVELARILAEEGFIEGYDLVRTEHAAGQHQGQAPLQEPKRARDLRPQACEQAGTSCLCRQGGDPQVLRRTRSGGDVHVPGRHDRTPGVAQRHRRRASLLRVVNPNRPPLPQGEGENYEYQPTPVRSLGVRVTPL